MKTTLKKLSIPKPSGGFDELYIEDFISKEKLKEQIAELKKLIYRLHFETDETTDLHPFYIKSLEDDNVVYNSNSDCRLATHAADVEYSYGDSWMNLGNVETIAVNEGEKVYFRYIGSEYLSGEVLTSTTKTFDVGGDIRTIIYGNKKVESVSDYELKGLFRGTNVVNANQLLMVFNSVGVSGYESMFKNCTSLISSPELPATTLANWCYQSMFQGCTSLTTAPELPATTLADMCYYNMFQGCTSLTTAPELPATTLAGMCYYNMFQGCTSLTTAPELPATTLVDWCYNSMFYGCTSLTTAPELPATTLANNCYYNMFRGCTSLTTSPELPATTLAVYCYYSMFYGCTSLNTAPALHATTLADYCYGYMFQGCSNLNYIKCLATDISAEDCTYNWVSGVAPTGTFVKDVNSSWTVGDSGIPEGWVSTINMVIFTAEEAGSTIGLNKLSSYQTLEYKTASSDWTSMNTSTNITLDNIGDKVYVRGVLSGDNTDSNYTQFKITGKITASGNCNALWNYNNLNALLKEYCGYYMFKGCKSLTTTPELPATTLAGSCYSSMFLGCTSLTQAPELPATTLASGCYSSMFQNCSSLTTTPELPATTLASGCYNSIFSYCTSLTTTPELPATTLANWCYKQMFQNCTSLTQAPELPATKLADSCYRNMFWGCTSLTTAPELPATTLVDWCYNSMFYGCTSLTTAPELTATTLTYGCYSSMFYGCTSLTQPPELPATTLASYCYDCMFAYCTSLITAPELTATTLAESCYSSMFSGCSNLNYIKCLATDRKGINCIQYWVSEVASTGTFVKAAGTYWPTSTSGIPEGWTVIEE